MGNYEYVENAPGLGIPESETETMIMKLEEKDIKEGKDACEAAANLLRSI